MLSFAPIIPARFSFFAMKANPRNIESNERAKPRSSAAKGREFDLNQTWKRSEAIRNQAHFAKPRRTPRRNRRGSALVEFTLALLLGALVLNQVISFIHERASARAATLEARYLTDLTQAGRRLLTSQTQSLTIGSPVLLSAQDLATQGFLDEGRVYQSVTGRVFSVALLPRSTNETVILARATPHAGEPATPVAPKSGEGIARVGAVYSHAPDALRGPSLNYDLSWMTGGFGALKPVVGDLAALDVFRADQSITPYLHREAQPSAPELNQMQTSLDMGGNNITGVAQVTATTVDVTEQLSAETLTGTTRVIGPLTVQSLTANSTATIEGMANVLGRITAPELIVSGRLQTQRLDVDSATISGSISATTATVTGAMSAETLAADQLVADRVESTDATIRHLASELVTATQFTSATTGTFESLSTGSCSGC